MDKANAKNYPYGFVTKTPNDFHFGKGHSEEIVNAIWQIKNEPQWMLEARISAYRQFTKMPNPTWGPDLKDLQLDEIIYYYKSTDRKEKTWEEIPQSIKNTLNRLGISDKEKDWLGGISLQFDSESIYASAKSELEQLGVIMTSTDEALAKYPELFRKYFGTIVSPSHNKYAALNSAFWSGGTFIYVPKNVKLDRPVQSYFRINARESGQFERTIIIVDDDASIHYVEGCTAPVYRDDNLHAAVVEVFVGKRASCKYSTIQNWSDNVINLVTKSAIVDDHGTMEWVDGNLGSKINMKYPSTILQGDFAKGSCLSVAIANGPNIIQDAGAKMIHLGNFTTSNILSKSIAMNGGVVNYRGTVKIESQALQATSKVECDTMIIDELSKSDTIPSNIAANATSSIEHEATVSSISDEEIHYLRTKGLSSESAREIIVMGFIEPFAKEIPLEYASELNKLIKFELESEIG